MEPTESVRSGAVATRDKLAIALLVAGIAMIAAATFAVSWQLGLGCLGFATWLTGILVGVSE